MSLRDVAPVRPAKDTLGRGTALCSLAKEPDLHSGSRQQHYTLRETHGQQAKPLQSTRMGSNNLGALWHQNETGHAQNRSTLGRIRSRKPTHASCLLAAQKFGQRRAEYQVHLPNIYHFLGTTPHHHTIAGFNAASVVALSATTTSPTVSAATTATSTVLPEYLPSPAIPYTPAAVTHG